MTFMYILPYYRKTSVSASYY